MQRSKSTPSNLPWASLLRASKNPEAAPPSDSNGSSLAATPHPPFAQSKVSAFRPITNHSEAAPPVVCGELPRGLHPHQLSPNKMRNTSKRLVESLWRRMLDDVGRLQRKVRPVPSPVSQLQEKWVWFALLLKNVTRRLCVRIEVHQSARRKARKMARSAADRTVLLAVRSLLLSLFI
ncbi:unnamed protein product [Heligmosomoides polygyrus]|uniref:Uncharacterized protein n=1 Tax=Heligmosomoides polygyrus TaxID=6339 RepID=A0A183GS86_HELPZ|nr:unnamed protein product [Heligmosomoides polygyrus]